MRHDSHMKHCCVPGLGLGSGFVTSLLKEHNSSPFISSLQRRHSLTRNSQVWIETRWFRTCLPTLCYHHWAPQKEWLVKPRWVFPCVPGGKAGVNGGLRGDCHCGGFTTLLSGSTLPEAEGGQDCWELVCRIHLAQTSLSFRKGIFKNYKNNWTL